MMVKLELLWTSPHSHCLSLEIFSNIQQFKLILGYIFKVLKWRWAKRNETWYIWESDKFRSIKMNSKVAQTLLHYFLIFWKNLFLTTLVNHSWNTWLIFIYWFNKAWVTFKVFSKFTTAHFLFYVKGL